MRGYATLSFHLPVIHRRDVCPGNGARLPVEPYYQQRAQLGVHSQGLKALETPRRILSPDSLLRNLDGGGEKKRPPYSIIEGF